MQVKDLIPWARGSRAPDTKERSSNPILQLQEEMNRLFEGFWSRFERQVPAVGSTPYPTPFGGIGFPWNGAMPRADVVETDDGVEVTVELPGLEQKDVEVTLTDDLLTVKGEKKVAHEESRKGYYLSERAYGAFHRAIPLPPGVDSEKAEAVFRNGVLTVKLPQSAEARAKVRRIEVKAA
jgi:HSP20 family protein